MTVVNLFCGMDHAGPCPEFCPDPNRRSAMQHKADAPHRSVTDIGPGDYIKDLSGQWVQVTHNTAAGAERTPREWTVTADGRAHGMYSIRAYAKAEDFTGGGS
jgi:hypothetical protein